MSIKKQLEENIVSVAVGVAVATSVVVWVAIQKVQIEPRDRDISNYREVIIQLKETINELNTATNPYRKNIETLSENNQRLKNNVESSRDSLAQCKDVISAWQKQNTELTKNLNLYESNCSIISEIRGLDSRKLTLERELNRYIGSSSRNEAEIEEWHRQADQYQIRIIDLQKRLQCQQ